MKSLIMNLVAMPLCIILASAAVVGEPRNETIGKDISAIQLLILDIETEMMVAIFDNDIEKAYAMYNALTDIEMFVYGYGTSDQGRNGLTTASLGSGRFTGSAKQ